MRLLSTANVNNFYLALCALIYTIYTFFFARECSVGFEKKPVQTMFTKRLKYYRFKRIVLQFGRNQEFSKQNAFL